MNALLKKSIAEFIGVTVFLTAITASIENVSPLISLAIALGIMILVTGPISGGHLNPAVSLYFYIKREITLGTLLAYVGAQLLGGLAGAALGHFLHGEEVAGFVANSTNLSPAALVGEVVATAGLVWVIATLISTKQTSWIPFAVAAWVLSAANFTATGAQANPAVTLGAMFRGALAPNQGVSLMVAQIAGLLLALILTMVFAPAAKKTAAKKK